MYNSKFGTVRLQKSAQQPSIGRKKIGWGKIFAFDGAGWGKIFAFDGAGASCSSSSGMGSCISSTPSLSRRTSASAVLHAASTTADLGIGSELSSYLDSDIVDQYDADDFNILIWWYEHKLTYPVFSILAKDVLTLPISTISSESAFSITGRIIEERRRRLNPEMEEMLTCTKDWEACQARAQHSVENKDLETSFRELFLDGPSL
jgi:hypothetical protein